MTDSDEGSDGAGPGQAGSDDGVAGNPPASATADDTADESGSADAAGAPRDTGDESDASAGAAEDSERAAVDDARVGVEQDLNGRVRLLWIAGSTFGALFLGVGATLVAHFVFEQYRWAGAALFGVLAVIGIVRAVLLYRSWYYVVREESLFLHRGVLTRVQTVAPYVRVQHIDTRRSPLERVVGLSTLVVYTAGSRGADVTIPGLTPDRAADLQERLKRLAIESEEEDAV